MEPPAITIERWKLWTLVFRALEKYAPEALEDLARIPYPRGALEAARVWGWPALVRAEGEEAHGLREALESWGKRWNLGHPIALDLALQTLEDWARGIARPPRLGPGFVGPVVDLPAHPPPSLPLPPWHPLQESWDSYRARVEALVGAALEGYRKAVLEAEGLTGRALREAQGSAVVFVLHRVKGWPLRSLRARAKEEGLVERGRVVVPALSPAAMWERLKRFEEALGVAMPEQTAFSTAG